MAAALWCGAGTAATYTIDTGRDKTWAVFRIAGDGTVDYPFTGPSVGVSGSTSFRSVISFDLRSIPDTEKIAQATLQLSADRVDIRGIESIGSVRHMDASVPPRIVSRPIDPFRFAPASITVAPLVTNLNLGLDGAYNVTAAVAQDHLAGHVDSPLGLLENSDRFSRLSVVTYSAGLNSPAPRLVVETSAPEAVAYEIESLGGARYRATYQFRNEISLPLSLIDIEFDTVGYREDSLRVLTGPQQPTNWDSIVLASGLDVPAAVSFAATGGGLSSGEVASGFQAEFEWIGAGLPGRQRYTVYDAQSFASLYSGYTAPVPWPASIWLMLGGLALIAPRVMKSKQRLLNCDLSAGVGGNSR